MIVVFVPELQALLAEARSVPTLLTRVLARAVSRPLDPAAAGAELLVGQPLAAAAVSRLRDAPGDAGGVWMRADPVGLVPDLNAVWIRPGARLETDHPALVELKALFAEAGLPFDLPQPERGYLRLDHAPDCRFVAPAGLAGLSLDHALPDGPDARPWKRLLNECQVILHQYRDGRHGRDRRNGPEVGGLWFWGPGLLPPRESLTARVSHLAASDPDLLVLADWLGLSHDPVDASSKPPSRVADASLACWQADPHRSADENLETLATWLRPLWRRLRSGRIKALELAGRERAWSLGTGQSWQFWRRRPKRPS